MSGNSRPWRVRVTRRLPQATQALLAERYDVRFNDEDVPLDRAGLEEAMRGYDAVIPTITDRIDATLLNIEGRRAQVLANYGAGLDHIDLAAARRQGIVVTNTPDALTEATAELAILLMLMAARRAGEGERELRAGQWTGWRPTHLVGLSLAGRTLGLVGFGRIAQATAVKARGLGMTVRYHARSAVAGEIAAVSGASRAASIGDLAAEADVLSLHVPGGEATYHLVDAPLIARMKPHAILVNTARGPVVHEAALADALEAGHLGAVGLDVYEREPQVHPKLLANPRAVLLPHLGSATIEARNAMGMQAVANLHAFVEGREPPNRVV